tara:strand:+ start:99 stop:566 length:468 start_codon:yes stop_codon:yes gene_type:complete
MFFYFKNHAKIISFLLVFILIGCQLQEPSKNHGIIFLKNRSDKLIVNKSNTNDVIKIIGNPHSKSINNENEWIYFERILTKGSYYKLGQNVLKTNNILVLNFDKFGVLKSKQFLVKEDKKKLKFSEKKTENNITQKSFVERFLSSVKSKMYSNKK